MGLGVGLILGEEVGLEMMAVGSSSMSLGSGNEGASSMSDSPDSRIDQSLLVTIAATSAAAYTIFARPNKTCAIEILNGV